MFANKIFRTAFLISLTWHVACMYAFNIVVLPGRYAMRDLTAVSFLGPILEETALEIILANKPVAVTTSYQRDLKYAHHITGKSKGIAIGEKKRHVYSEAEENIDKVFSKKFTDHKAMPKVLSKRDARKEREKTISEISGSLASRELLYKPDKPVLPSWIPRGTTFALELECAVSPQGEIKKVNPVVSSGNPEVDLLGIRYLKAWRFAPAQRLQKEQRVRIRLTFEARESEFAR